jgi:hypothetical protein
MKSLIWDFDGTLAHRLVNGFGYACTDVGGNIGVLVSMFQIAEEQPCA